ncbi:MAG: phage major capsid protein [Candidatus Nitrohelix vancouverensis]|uniref:Phage major capsid protein n=1 Tax=Candidatus Nitrohelix vancouverensis TaxID=2705534 RepID=A0A7T0G2Q7_9BACT|nr:MAG: phage major capsid protein [Candidatus Nitrohelix vancouverensis]
MNEVKTLVDDLNKAFLEHKNKNDQRLSELEKRGHADPLLENQVDRITRDLQELLQVKERVERLQALVNRPAFDMTGETKPERKARDHAILTYIRKGESALAPQEVKLLSSDSDPDGGYWVASAMSDRVVQKIHETSPMRHVAAVEMISGDALEIPEDINEADAGWTSEQASRTETATPEIGVRRIPVHELYAQPKATQTLLDDARIDVESWLAGKIADKISRMENAAFISGDGVGKPRGLLTYPTGTTNPGQVQQVNSGASAALTADGLRALFYALKSPYAERASWLMSRSSVEAVSKLKDTSGQYLWQPGLQAGEPQTLMGRPIERMEDMPDVAANSLSVAFGDWHQAYAIVDRIGIRVLRDPFSAKPFVMFYTTKRTGGDVTNFEALVLQKTAS